MWEERLIVLVEARIRDFEKNMAKASGTAGRTYDGMRRSSRSATRQMEADMIRSTGRINQALAVTAGKIGTFGKAFVGGLVGGVVAGGVAGIVSQLQDVAGGVAAIGDEAKRAGVDVKSFQELKFVAEQNRIGVDSLTDGIKELNLRADEFILTGKGSAAEAFQRLGFSAETLKQKLQKPSELFTEIIGKLGKFDRAAQIRIADEIFGGTGGEKFVQLVEQGEQGIRDTIKAANDLGIVMNEEMIEKAVEVDRRFNLIANTVGTVLKSAIVSAVDSLAEFIDGFREFENQHSRTLQSGLTDIGQKRLDIETEILKLQHEQRNNTSALAQAENRNIDATIASLKEQSEALNKQEAQILAILEERTKPMARSGNDTWTPPDPSSFITPTTSASERKLERERQAVHDLIVELQEELRLIGATDAERRASEASRMAGAAATEEERQQIIALNEAIYQEAAALDERQQVLDLYRDTTRGAIDDLISGAEQGKTAWETLADTGVNALRRVSSALIDDVLNSIFQVNNAASGGSLFGNLFAGIFGGGMSDPWADLRLPSFDGGGSTGSGPRTGGMDGRGGFPAIVHPQETIVDHTRGQSAGGQNVHVTSDVRVSVDDSGNLRAFVERTSVEQSRSVLRTYDRSLPDRLQQINRNPTKRHSGL